MTNSGMTLTPAQFLSLNPKIGLPGFAVEDEHDSNYSPKVNSAETLIRIWKKGLKHLDKFWQVGRDAYLLNLRERTQTTLKTPRIQTSTAAKAGHIVLIKDDLPRGCWRIGKIQELIKSRDQQKRSAKVLLLSKKIIGRPLNLLYPIECSEEEQCFSDGKPTTKDSPENGPVGRNQPTRQAAKGALKQIKQ